MNEHIRDIFRTNIKHYEEAKAAAEKADVVTKEMLNQVCARFFIITAMRETYGCPSCNSEDKCSCKVISGISKYVSWSRGAKGYPKILW